MEGGLAASLVYMALPLRILDLYFTGIFASKLAYAWFPLILYFTRRAVKEDRFGANATYLAVIYALLCLTHLISAYMMLPVLLGFAAVSAGRGKLFLSLIRVSSGCLLGLMLSTFYILPALYEQKFVHFEELSNKWWLQYWNTYPFYIFSQEPPEPLNFNHYLAKVILATVLFGASLYLLPRRCADGGRKPEPAYFITVVACALFLMSSLSGFLWATVPGLHLLQFPMRWTSMMVLGTACLAGSVVGPVLENGIDFRKSMAVVSCAFIAGASLLVLYFDADIVRNSCHTEKQEVESFPSDLDVEEYIPRKVSLAWLKAERKKPPSEKVAALVSGKVYKLDVVEWRPEERLFDLHAGGDAVLRIRTFYYPGWHAFVDGQEVSLGSEDVSGAMLLRIPKGGHRVRICFLDTAARRLAMLSSALAALLTVYLLGRDRLRARVKATSSS